MMKRSGVIGVVLGIVATTGVVLASPRATLTLRNGDRIQTELVDLGGVGYTIKTNGRTETLPADDVALIDFAGGAASAAEVARMQDGRPFIVLRNGDLIAGRLIDIGGVDPLRLTVRTDSGNQDFNSNEVARLFLTKWQGMPVPRPENPVRPSPQGQPGQREVIVPGTSCWVRTGIEVIAGQRVVFSGSGEVQLSGNPADLSGVAGSRIGKELRRSPLPGLAGALIGRIGNRGEPFGIGDQRQALGMPDSGELFLGINDDNCRDNRGEYRVRIDVRR